MVINHNTKVNAKKLDDGLQRYGTDITYKFSADTIRSDINKLELYRDGASNTRKKNIELARKYLEKLLKKAEKGNVTINWFHSKNRIWSTPEIRKLSTFNIEVTDYFMLRDKNILFIDYSQVMNLLAFELTYIDLGFTQEDVETKLEGMSIVSVHDANELYDLGLVDSRLYKDALGLRVDDMQFLAPDRVHIYDYFGNQFFMNGSYHEIVKSTSDNAMSIIVENILTRAMDISLDMQVAGIYEDCMYLILPKEEDSSIVDYLIESVLVTVFGRSFEVKPKTQMYLS